MYFANRRFSLSNGCMISDVITLFRAVKIGSKEARF
jgi:hypothetical protein